MLVRQVNESSRGRKRIWPRGDSGRQCQGAGEVGGGVRVARQFRMAGSRQRPDSALKLREAYAAFDAESLFDSRTVAAKDNPACECGAILRGAKRPHDCKLFGTVCTPETPMGSCMVSSEGSCAAHWTYGRFRDCARDMESVMSALFRCRKLDLKWQGRSLPWRGRPRHGAVDRRHFHAALSPTTWLAQGNDQAVLSVPPGRLAMTTDGYVVSPLFFPGGDIGSLAVHGTINDLAMAGAQPLHLSASFIIEEGFPLADLRRDCAEHGRGVARGRACPIVTGDTKVVERGKADGVFISTAGVGVVPRWPVVSPATGRGRATRILLSGIDWRSWRRHHVEARKSAIRDADRFRLRRAARAWSRTWSRRLRHASAADARSDARRPRRDAQRDRAAVEASASASRRRHAGEAGSGRRLRTARDSIRSNVANEGKLLAVVAPEGGSAAWGHARASAWPRRGDYRRRCGRRAPLRADDVVFRRRSDRRLARGRTIAPYLLMALPRSSHCCRRYAPPRFVSLEGPFHPLSR